MRLIIVGAEYTGKTTLVEKIVDWRDEVMGPPTPKGIVRYHDHFTLPWVGHWDEISEEDLAKFMSLGPELKEMFQRYQFHYHLMPQLYRDTDHIMVGFHIEEAVYAPLYYGYGRAGEYGDRESLVRHIETDIIEAAPDTVLVLLKASPEVVREPDAYGSPLPHRAQGRGRGARPGALRVPLRPLSPALQVHPRHVRRHAGRDAAGVRRKLRAPHEARGTSFASRRASTWRPAPSGPTDQCAPPPRSCSC